MDCQHKIRFGRQLCPPGCPAGGSPGIFRSLRVERPEDLPPADEKTIDVALLDMNHGWPNLGHDSIVHAVQDAACDLVPLLARCGLSVRVLSFDVRRRQVLPEPPGDRFTLYVGSGGPGHIDPRLNDGISPESQGILEDPGWEAPLFHLFDRILEDERAALLSVCHTFGVMCRWLGVARAVLRGPEKGGKSAGILENILTREGAEHPWFRHLARRLPDGRRLRILDNRLFDLIPDGEEFRVPVLPIGYEALGVGGPQGDALTMMEVARDPGGLVPRIFGANHHPEVVNRRRLLQVLQLKFDQGHVGQEWFEERMLALEQTYPDEDSDRELHLTSDFTILGPIRFYVHRQARLRAEALGFDAGIHEDSAAALTIRSAA